MRLSTFAAALLIAPLAASAQKPSPLPPPPPAAGGTKALADAAAERAANTPKPIDTRKNGGPNSAFVMASQFLDNVHVLCTVLPNDGKLFADCDNTTLEAKMPKAQTYLPQFPPEWERFTRQIADADFTVTGKRRPVVVMNNGVVMAESSSGGVVKLRK